MGNAQARRRLNAKDFQYIAKNTALLNMQIVTEYYTELIQKYPDGKMEVEDEKSRAGDISGRPAELRSRYM